MQRRYFTKAAAGSLLVPNGLFMTEIAGASAQDLLTSLKKTDRMPVMFVGHGSPMNAIGDNEYRRSWQVLGAEFGSKYPVPQLILCISAHWLTEGWWLTAMDKPKTIHDFGGFRRSCLTSNTRRQAIRRPRGPSATWCASGRPRLWAWTWASGVWTTAPGRCSSPCFPARTSR